MSYRYSPWESLKVILRDARRLRREGRRLLAIKALDAVAENRRRWLTTGSFHPQYIKKEGTK